MRSWGCSPTLFASSFFLFAASLTRAEQGEASLAWCEGGIVHEIKLPAIGSPLLIDIEVGGEKRKFMVDTGTANTIFDDSLREYLAAPIDREVSGQDNSKVTRHPATGYQHGILKSCRSIECVDLSTLAAPLGEDLGGIIGVDALESFTLHLNSDRRTLVLVDPSAHGEPPGEILSMHRDKYRRPYVVAQISRRQRACLLDTGAFFSLSVDQEHYDDLIKAGRITDVTAAQAAKFTTIIKSVRLGRLSMAILGDLTCRNIVINDASQPTIGLYYLARYNVTLDFRKSQVYLEQSRHAQIWDGSDKDGLTLEEDEHGFYVRSTDPGSLAEKAGFLKGDQILTINEIPIKKLSHQQLGRVFTFRGPSAVEFVIKRDGFEMPIRLSGVSVERLNTTIHE